jgi:hypothetical protein
MKWKLRILKSLAGLLALSLFTGCNSILGVGQEDESTVPHSQPAAWEGQVPGMPTSRG